MKFLCDENLPVSLAAELRSVGLDAVDVRERGLAGANDDQVLAYAQAEGRVIVTLDVRRFGNLIATLHPLRPDWLWCACRRPASAP